MKIKLGILGPQEHQTVVNLDKNIFKMTSDEYN